MNRSEHQAFLALWNGVTQDADQLEYETWHSFEHVPERVALPGFVQGTRYRSLEQPRRYFTCYGLRGLDALETPAYGEVFTHPTPWSARMRRVLCDFYRLPCEVHGAFGVGTASQLATVLWRSSGPGLMTVINTNLQAQVAAGRLVRAEWGTSAPGESYWLPNVDRHLQGDGAHHVALLQHLDPHHLHLGVRSLVAALGQAGVADVQVEHFVQLTHVRHDALSGTPGVRRPPRTTLFDHFKGD